MPKTEQIIDAEVVDDEPTERTPRQNVIAELRYMLTVLEENPQLPLPHGWGKNKYDTVNFFAETAAEAAGITRAMGGKWTKNDPTKSDYAADNLVLGQIIGTEVHVDVVVSRGRVCEKVVTGTTQVKKMVLVSEPVYEERYVDQDVVDYKCGSLLNAAEREALEEL